MSGGLRPPALGELAGQAACSRRGTGTLGGHSVLMQAAFRPSRVTTDGLPS